ncbi:MAG TPA: hypothetical protein VFQ07_08595 [Candidatus Polarisedimenticolia bacterium]|nr:hypothetical protein [Candidatus Polarisedimenticolia bacterium]
MTLTPAKAGSAGAGSLPAGRRQPTGRAALLIALPLMTAALLLSLDPVRAAIGPGRLPAVVLWGLPALALLLAFAGPPLPARDARLVASASAPFFSPALRILPWMAGAFLLDQSFMGIAHLLGWVSFTYGDQNLAAHPLKTVLIGVPACLLLGSIGTERALRSGVLDGAAKRWGMPAGLALSVAAGLALTVPALVGAGEFGDPSFVAAALVVALVREIGFCLIYLRGGGLPLAGLGRGLLMFFEGRIITDVESLFLPLAQYTTSEPRFDLLRAATAVAALLLVIWGCRRSTAGASDAGVGGGATARRAASE